MKKIIRGDFAHGYKTIILGSIPGVVGLVRIIFGIDLPEEEITSVASWIAAHSEELLLLLNSIAVIWARTVAQINVFNR